MILTGGDNTNGSTNRSSRALAGDGSTTTINGTTLDVDDLNITVAKGAADSAAADGASHRQAPLPHSPIAIQAGGT